MALEPATAGTTTRHCPLFTAPDGTGWEHALPVRRHVVRSTRTRSAGEAGGLGRVVPEHAAKADVPGRRVDRLPLASGRPVAQAVVRRAQVRAALGHPSRDA